MDQYSKYATNEDVQRLFEFQSSSLQRRAIGFGEHMMNEAVQRYISRGHSDFRPVLARVLAHLSWDGSRLVDIALAMGVTKNSVAQQISELIALGYLQRVPDPSDGRAKLIQYTDEGLRLLGDAIEIGDEIRSELVALIGERKVEMLHSILNELADAQTQAAQSASERLAHTVAATGAGSGSKGAAES